MDLKSYSRWDDYSRARDEMFLATDTSWAPWLRGVHLVEQQQLCARTMFGEHAEIGAPGGKRRSEREAFAFVLDGVGRHGVRCP
jgi:hypothetical protein